MPRFDISISTAADTKRQEAILHDKPPIETVTNSSTWHCKRHGLISKVLADYFFSHDKFQIEEAAELLTGQHERLGIIHIENPYILNGRKRLDIEEFVEIVHINFFISLSNHHRKGSIVTNSKPRLAFW